MIPDYRGRSNVTLLDQLIRSFLYSSSSSANVGSFVPASGLEQSEIDAIQESELTSAYESLLKYRDICEDEGVSKPSKS